MRNLQNEKRSRFIASHFLSYDFIVRTSVEKVGLEQIQVKFNNEPQPISFEAAT